jgi:KUP system potassium uptake protein
VVELVRPGHEAADHTDEVRRRRTTPLALLTLGALGVVFGDIGTSPLYAMHGVVFSSGAVAASNRDDVLGAVSLVFWILMLVVTVKYLVVVFRADYEGEGGVFALFALIRPQRTRYVLVVGPLLLLAAGLLLGDGVITPAISVLAAVEGLGTAAPSLTGAVIPVAVVVLVAVFLLQSRGSRAIGAAYGPVMLVWFGVLTALGIASISRHPGVLAAVNPVYAVGLIGRAGLAAVVPLLGAAILVGTGADSMFADLGHFGRRPIRLAWATVAMPALIANYAGQGAHLLAGEPVDGGSLFFSMVPDPFTLPMVVLATAAAVIASQALISGAFSLVSQGMALEVLPRMRVVHTHHEHRGQIYLPAVNWLLLVGSVMVVLGFRSSSSLAHAYGAGITGVMLCTTLGVAAVARHRWKWPTLLVAALAAPFVVVDVAFLVGKSAMFLDGAWLPLGLGAALASMMATWQWGRRQVRTSMLRHSTITMRDLLEVKRREAHHFPKSMILLSNYHVRRISDPAPPIAELFLRRFRELPRHLIILTIRQTNHPYVRGKERYEIEIFENDPERNASFLSVEASFGFMEEPDVEAVIADLAADQSLTSGDDLADWIILATKERVVSAERKHLGSRLRFELFRLLARSAEPSWSYLGLADDTRLTVEFVPVQL